MSVEFPVDVIVPQFMLDCVEIMPLNVVVGAVIIKLVLLIMLQHVALPVPMFMLQLLVVMFPMILTLPILLMGPVFDNVPVDVIDPDVMVEDAMLVVAIDDAEIPEHVMFLVLIDPELDMLPVA